MISPSDSIRSGVDIRRTKFVGIYPNFFSFGFTHRNERDLSNVSSFINKWSPSGAVSVDVSLMIN